MPSNIAYVKHPNPQTDCSYSSTLQPYVSGPNSVKVANPVRDLEAQSISIDKAYLGIYQTDNDSLQLSVLTNWNSFLHQCEESRLPVRRTRLP